MWKFAGASRPSFAVTPGPGQESVWDYPRPPRLLHDPRLVEVKAGTVTIGASSETLRVIETASPPTFYLPPRAIDWSRLTKVSGASVCEWKGRASYWAIAGSDTTPVAWTYDDPSAQFAAIRGYISFYPGRVECYVAEERVQAQPGGFYGGWITHEVVGPFKGEPGTSGW